VTVATIILLARTVWPFIKEIILRDMYLKEILVANKTATMLALCLVIVLAMTYYIAGVAADREAQLENLKKRYVELELMYMAVSSQESDSCPVCMAIPVPEPIPPKPERDAIIVQPPPRTPIKTYAITRLKERE